MTHSTHFFSHPNAESPMPQRPAASAILFTDGACLGNPGPGGCAALIRIGGQERIITARDPATTNNQMEMAAAIKALEALPPGLPAILHSDSQYGIKAIREWLPGWKRRGWRTAAGEAVKNQPLWEALDRLNSGRTIRWPWGKGHAGHQPNERVDGLANAEARRAAGALR